MTKRTSKPKPVETIEVKASSDVAAKSIPVEPESSADKLTRIMSELQSLSLDNSAAQGMVVAARLLIGNALRTMG